VEKSLSFFRVKSLLSQTSRVRRKTERRLETHKRAHASFFVFIGLAAAIAALGILLDNASIVIGAMVVAPLVTPVFGFSLSLIVFRVKRMFMALASIVLGTLLAVFVSWVVAYGAFVLGSSSAPLTGELLSRAEPNILFFLVALLSGAAGAYAYARPKMIASITGIAISVAVVPPLAASGVAFAAGEWFIAEQSFLLYLFNLAGICFGSVAMFLILGFGKDIETP